MPKDRKRDYIFLRANSSNWHVRLQRHGKSKAISLGTPDRAAAEILALPYILEHKRTVLAERPRLAKSWCTAYEPGRTYPDVDGGTIVAEGRTLIHIDRDGKIIGRSDNGRMVLNIASGDTVLAHDITDIRHTIDGDQTEGRLIERWASRRHDRPAVPTKDGDDALLDTYIAHKGITGYFEREARSVWEIYKALGGKPLKDATRDDGRLLVKHYQAQGAKSKTIQKKIGWLCAMCNLAIDEGKLKANPFSKITPKLDDEEERLPLSDDDMVAVRRNLDKLSASDQLLVRLLASTGMRLGEAMEIESEHREKGVRFVIVGTKTKQSKRRVPFPAAVLPHLPRKITGKLFPGEEPAASKRLNRFLNDIGITDRRKVAHSWRHRAQDRLRAAGCPKDMRQELLGHDKVTVGDNYGEGSPVPMLKKWIDRIGV
jgi:integrase